MFQVFPIISLVNNQIPGVRHVWGHSFNVLSNCKAMGANDHQDGATIDHMGMLCGIYVKLHIAIVPYQIQKLWVLWFQPDKIFYSCISHCKPMTGNDTLGRSLCGAPGSRLSGFIKKSTMHCYTQNIKALGILVSEKKIFSSFSLFPFVSLFELWSYLLPWKPEF